MGMMSVCSALLAKPFPRYSLHNMPQTGFTCRDKILGGYYADSETQCQMFHVCVKVAGVGVQDFRFLCPNGTAFDQEAQTCADWGDVDCDQATLFYGSDNFDLYRIGSGFESKKAPSEDDEDTFHLQRAESNDLRGIKSTAVSGIYQNRHFSEPTTQSIAQPSLRNDYTKLNPVSFYQSTTTSTTTKSPPTKPFVRPVNVAAKIEDYSLNANPQKDSTIDNDTDEIFKASHSSNFFNNRNGKDEGFDDVIVRSKPASPQPNRRHRGRKVYKNSEASSRSSTFESTSATTPSHHRSSTSNAIHRERKPFQSRNDFGATAQRGDNFRQNTNATPTPRAPIATTKAEPLTESIRIQNNNAPNVNNNFNFDRFSTHRTTSGQYTNRVSDKPAFNVDQTSRVQTIQRNEFDNGRQNNFNSQASTNNQPINNHTAPNSNSNFQTQPTRPTTYVTIRPVAKSNQENEKRIETDLNNAKNYYNAGTLLQNSTAGKDTSNTFTTQSHEVQSSKQDHFQGNRNFDRFSTGQYYDPYFSKQQSSTQTPTTAIQQHDGQYNKQNFNQQSNFNQQQNFNQQSNFNQQPNFNQKSNFDQQPNFNNAQPNYNNQQPNFNNQQPNFNNQQPNFNQQNGFFNNQPNLNKFPLADVKPTTYSPQHNGVPNRSQVINSTPRGFSLPSTTAKTETFNEKNYETQFAETQTPTSPKRFSTLVPKNLYPTTFKPTTYKSLSESPIASSNQFDNNNQFYSKQSTAPYYNSPSKVTYPSTTTTTSTTTTVNPRTATENIEDDGQYHPELYEQDLPKYKLKQKKVENQFKVTQSDNGFRSNHYQNRQSNPHQSSFVQHEEDEFLQTAHSQNIAASGNELRAKNLQKSEVKHTFNPVVQTRPSPTPSASTKKSTPSDKDASYDYAYYDTLNDEPSEYSEYGLKEFKRTSAKKY
ncbi:hypothetical protein HA402_001647 [Bradysia odoriphaga]|nr:hypothetical protein HA402_001647 [Bradysia odoriphaga]